MEVQTRLIEKLVFNTRNPRRNDKTVDRVYGEVGLKIPYLARSGTRRKSEGGGRGTNRAGRRSRRAIRSGAGGRKGSRNKPKSEAENLLDQYAPQLMKTCIGLAAKGNPTALRLCIERLLPARRDASVRVRLPPIKTVQDVDRRRTE
jgi:hypothetical protein